MGEGLLIILRRELSNSITHPLTRSPAHPLTSAKQGFENRAVSWRFLAGSFYTGLKRLVSIA
jgi:hypothetical protein